MTASRQSRESLQPARNTRNDSGNISGTNTGKQRSRVAQATLNHLNGTGSSAATGSKSHLLNMPLAVDEEDTLGVKQLEELMRASQKSGLLKMLQSQPRESRDQQ